MDIFLFTSAIISKALPVKSSAPAIITKISPNEKASQATIFISPKGEFCNHDILVIEKVAHKAMYIPANIPETKVWENGACAFFSQRTMDFAVISAGDKRSIIQQYVYKNYLLNTIGKYWENTDSTDNKSSLSGETTWSSS